MHKNSFFKRKKHLMTDFTVKSTKKHTHKQTKKNPNTNRIKTGKNHIWVTRVVNLTNVPTSKALNSL